MGHQEVEVYSRCHHHRRLEGDDLDMIIFLLLAGGKCNVMHSCGRVLITISATWVPTFFLTCVECIETSGAFPLCKIPLYTLYSIMTTSRAREDSPSGAGPSTKKPRRVEATDYINKVTPGKLQQYQETYKQATPYRHAVVKDFLSDELVSSRVNM